MVLLKNVCGLIPKTQFLVGIISGPVLMQFWLILNGDCCASFLLLILFFLYFSGSFLEKWNLTILSLRLCLFMMSSSKMLVSLGVNILGRLSIQ